MPEGFLITNHGLILLAIAKRPHSTVREIGDAVGITERAAHSIIEDLEASGYITRTKVGRRNRYQIEAEVPLKEEAGATVGEFMMMLGWKPREKRSFNG